MATKKLKVAVIEGQHPYDAVAFHKLFRDMDQIDYYLQGYETWACDWGANADQYDAVLFYHFHQEMPQDPSNPMRIAVDRLGRVGKGIIVLHHAILAFPKEPQWSALTGIADRAFNYFPEQDLVAVPASIDHPIIDGITPFEIHDETYTMNEPDAHCEVLLTTHHENSMKALAWTRKHHESGVFCFQLGHDDKAWANAGFQTLLHRGILWSTGRL